MTTNSANTPAVDQLPDEPTGEVRWYTCEELADWLDQALAGTLPALETPDSEANEESQPQTENAGKMARGQAGEKRPLAVVLIRTHNC